MKTSPHRVLLVEDDADLRTLTAMSLRVFGGFPVRACGSGVEALKVLDREGADLMLLDLRMPGLDGFDVLGTIRANARHADLPVIAFSAGVDSCDVERLRALGVLTVVPKPFDPARLAHTVTALLEGRVPRTDVSSSQIIQKYALQFRDTLWQRAAECTRAWARAGLRGWPQDILEAAVKFAHRLAGSSGSFGFGQVSESARRLELLLHRTRLGWTPEPAVGTEVARELVTLSRLCYAASRAQVAPAPSREREALPGPVSGLKRE